MPVSTLSAAAHVTPTVVNTLIQHYAHKVGTLGRRKELEEEATDDVLFDEAFHIVKKFIQFGTHNTVDSLQAFTNTKIPSTFDTHVRPILIPLAICSLAATHILKAIKPSEIGGSKWWQVRGLEGVEAEWIASKKHIRSSGHIKVVDKRARQDEKMRREQEEHGKEGGTYDKGMHRLHRVMLYLHGGGFFWGSTNTHRYQLARHARKIAGRVFSVNYRMAPQYPFPCALQDALAAYLYLIEPPPDAAHRAIKPEKIVIAGDSAGGSLALALLTLIRDVDLPMPAGAVLISPWVDLTHSFPSVLQNTKTDIIPRQGFIHKPSTLWPPPPQGSTTHVVPLPDMSSPPVEAFTPSSTRDPPRTEPHYIRVSTPSDTCHPALQIHSQIQLYATNAQLTLPYVSPALHPSLGNLCPLYVLAGDKEVLRDEIIYTAHRAANPSKYPLREGLLIEGNRRELAEKFTRPTKVHLQVYDGMCHVLTTFSFSDPAKYAYRAIANFTKRVIDEPENIVAHQPFPRPDVAATTESSDLLEGETPVQGDTHPLRSHFRRDAASKIRQESYLENVLTPPRTASPEPMTPTEKAGAQVDENEMDETATAAGDSCRTSKDSRYIDNMIRERLSLHGTVRPLEPESFLQSLQVPPDEIGLIKEKPVMRWLEGMHKWDRRYKVAHERVAWERERNERKALELLRKAKERGLLGDDGKAVFGGGKLGPLDLEGETPPQSAIAGRRDTPDALALLKASLVPLSARPASTAEAFSAAIKGEETLSRPAELSAAEHQMPKGAHGVKMWSEMMSWFMERNKRRAKSASQKLSNLAEPVIAATR